jgi:hypothetical protein
LLDSTKSLAKALKAGLGSETKVKLHENTITQLQNDLVAARSKLKDVAKQIKENKFKLDNQLDAKHHLRLSFAKIDLEKQKVSLSREKEKKRKHDDVHQHRLTEVAAREALSKRVKDTAASHKTRIKEHVLETST